MFKRFDRLVPLFNSSQDTLSLYGDIMSYAFFNKNIENNSCEISPKEKWIKDFDIKDKGEFNFNKKIIRDLLDKK